MQVKYLIDEKTTIKDFIIKKISRNFYGYLKEMNAVFTVDGVEKKSYEEVFLNNELTISYFGEDKQVGLYSYNPLDIIYEDACFIVVDKEPHLLSIPSKREPNDSVYNRLLYYFKDTSNTVHLANRLDKEAKGLILVCKNKLARAALRDFEKVYIVKTDRSLALEKGTISDPIARSDDPLSIKRVVNQNEGDVAITHYELMSADDGIYTYKICLETGRTHQIRVHFAYYGCPLLGDQLYGGRESSDGTLQLLCASITYRDPFSKELKTFHSRFK